MIIWHPTRYLFMVALKYVCGQTNIFFVALKYICGLLDICWVFTVRKPIFAAIVWKRRLRLSFQSRHTKVRLLLHEHLKGKLRILYGQKGLSALDFSKLVERVEKFVTLKMDLVGKKLTYCNPRHTARYVSKVGHGGRWEGCISSIHRHAHLQISF